MSAALLLPAPHRLAQLEEGDDPRRDRQPERDHPVGEDGREHRRRGQAEQHEGADHAGVDRAHPARGEREQVGDHADEEPLDDHGAADAHVEGLEAGPEDRDVGRPEADRAGDRQAALRGGCGRCAIARRVPAAIVAGTVARRTARRPYRCSGEASAMRRWRSPGTGASSRKPHDQRRPRRAAGTIVSPAGFGPVQHPGSQQDPVDHQGEHVDGVEEDQEGDHPARPTACAASPPCAAPSR